MSINSIEVRWKEYEDRDPLCEECMYSMIDHGVNRLEPVCCLNHLIKDGYDEYKHPNDYDGPIFAHAPHDIWTLINIIKSMRSEIRNQPSLKILYLWYFFNPLRVIIVKASPNFNYNVRLGLK